MAALELNVRNVQAKTKVIDSGECGDDVSWKLYSDGLLEIKGDGDMEPSTALNKDKSFVKKIVVKEGVTSIPAGAFTSYFELKSVSLPKGLETIGRDAFAACIKLKTVKLSKGLLEIRDGAFRQCLKLKKLVIPASVEKVGKEVVYGCKALRNVYVKGSDTEFEIATFLQPKGREDHIYMHGGINVMRYVSSLVGTGYLEYKED